MSGDWPTRVLTTQVLVAAHSSTELGAPSQRLLIRYASSPWYSFAISSRLSVFSRKSSPGTSAPRNVKGMPRSRKPRRIQWRRGPASRK